MARAVLFDLDGTLLDTLTDLADAMNHTLASLGCPTRTVDEIRSFVGDGVVMLVRRALPQDRRALEDECLRLFKARYAAHMEDATAPFPGVTEMLDVLQAHGVRMAVVSNKFDGAVGPLCDRFFGSRIEVAIGGDRPGVPRKPAPDGCNLALELMGVSKEDAVYVGDSEPDIETARNAGLPCIIVSWGFRTRADMVAAGAELIADDVKSLQAMLLQ